MRGNDIHQQKLFSYISSVSSVSKNYPLQPIRKMVNSFEDVVNGGIIRSKQLYSYLLDLFK